MALYLIGDVQGCTEALDRLVQRIGFSPSRDTLCLLGDLVNRGPDSAGVIERAMRWDGAALCLLGNHDLHLLAVAEGIRPPHRADTVSDILQSPRRQPMLDWLRQQPLARDLQGWLLVHAGVLPGWSAAQALALAAEVQDELRGAHWVGFLRGMYGNEPSAWSDALAGSERSRVIVNALTRLRFCTPDGRMEFHGKGATHTAPPGTLPWFEVPGRCSAGTPVAFGHWSTLGLLQRPGLLGLDTGCVWGGPLSAARLEPAPDAGPARVAETIQVQGTGALAPGTD